ncbi:PEP-CTERM sorting domain-containing protein [Massilia sp. BJB1822]|uniref:PEP-CTERM sorting domain-containing protein n=1 Tax=Massilia sp. BJB1822 TaxID=2744470 RepID=UPI001593B802|nr:PEP-CTERM sorting domain-containing protein [Massilia sp. BJB1822]
MQQSPSDLRRYPHPISDLYINYGFHRGESVGVWGCIMELQAVPEPVPAALLGLGLLALMLTHKRRLRG